MKHKVDQKHGALLVLPYSQGVTEKGVGELGCIATFHWATIDATMKADRSSLATAVWHVRCEEALCLQRVYL